VKSVGRAAEVQAARNRQEFPQHVLIQIHLVDPLKNSGRRVYRTRPSSLTPLTVRARAERSDDKGESTGKKANEIDTASVGRIISGTDNQNAIGQITVQTNGFWLCI
jgi:hypothetical protein